MELTIRTIVVLMIILVAGLVFATMVLNWGTQGNEWQNDILDSLKGLIMGE